MHPSRVIRGARSQRLAGRIILVGVSGSIAAVEVVKVIRELLRHGAEVRAVMSPEATRIITPEALEFATGHPPILQLSGAVEHVSLLGPGEGRADLYLIAPATANTLGKIAHGIDDTPVTTFASVALGGGVPVLVAPAMHAHMGRNPAVAENLALLQKWGVGVIAPRSQEGEDKLASPEEIAAEVLRRLADSPWAGRRVTVIGGGSRESIDSVRSIANESTGETAVALAVQAHLRGAQVDLWLGAHTALVPPFLSVTRWRSVRDLANLARGRAEALRASALVIVPAALADYTTTPEPGKISSRARPRLSLRLDPAPKLLPLLRTLAPPPTRLVGFKLLAETDPQRLRTAAEQLAREAGADAIVANGVESIGNGRVRALWVTPEKVEKIEGTKVELADRILDLAEPSAGLDPVQTHASGLPAGRAPRGPRRARTGRGSAARSDPRRA
ncbi:MAG: bifunctional phosphopantothenoylcysteine decarboxylase/phosphopantothenate--cysteine ligase CoaBC [Thermoplasmata archaeon]